MSELKIGLIGAGGMGRAHVDRIENELSGGRITAVADLNRDAAREVAEPLGARVFTSGRELTNPTLWTRCSSRRSVRFTNRT